MLLDGLHIPVTTPFYPDGRLYLRKLEHNVDRYSRTPAAGLALLTRTGEASLLSDAEAREVLRTAVGASAPEKVLVANISRDAVLNTLDLADLAAELGYDAVLLGRPGSLAGEGETLRSLDLYFHAVADRSPLPILIEDDGTLPIELISELSANPAFCGISLGGRALRLQQVQAATLIAPEREVVVTTVFTAVTGRMQAKRDASGAGTYISAGSLTGGATALASAPPAPALKTRIKRVGFQMVSRRISGALEHLAAGATGLMPAFAACVPQAVYEVLAAWKDGNRLLAEEKQARLLTAIGDEDQLGVGLIKAACDLTGYYGGRPRLPLLPPSGEERRRIEELMLGMRN